MDEAEAENMAASTPSDSFIVDRWLDRLPWSRYASIVIMGLVLLLIGVVMILDLVVVFWRSRGAAPIPAPDMNWIRPIFPPLVIIYILLVVQVLERTRTVVAKSLRPLVQVDDDAYTAVLRRSCHAKPYWELISFGLGAGFFVLIVGRFGGPPGYYWLSFYFYITSLVMCGAVGWSVYAVIVIARLTNTLLHQPIEVDIFDMAPLEPIGRQSLYLSLAFLGAGILSFPSSPYPLLSWQNAAFYGVLILIIVLVFFVNMYSTHRLLAVTKHRQMAIAENEYAKSYRRLCQVVTDHQDTHAAATDVNAWAVAKHELKAARTWPYNTEMLRTLFISIMAPLAVTVSRLAAALFTGGGS